MTGELYIKTPGTNNQFVDAYTSFGMSLEDGGLARLMTPAPNKQPVANKNVVTDGASVVGVTIGCKDERTISVPFHVIASDQEDFILKYAALCAVLDSGYLAIKTKWQPNVVYNFIYIDCQQYQQFIGGMAKFTLSLYEPDPTNRT